MGTVRYTSPAGPPAPPRATSSKKGGNRKGAGSSGKARAAANRGFPSAMADPDDLSVAHALAQDLLDRKLASRDKWQIATQRSACIPA
jgi:hypothetical protein